MEIHLLLFGPHFERFFSNSQSDSSSHGEDIDKNLLKALAKYYGDVIHDNTVEFEDYLVEYFKIHYGKIVCENSGEFFYNFSNTSQDNKCDLYKIASFFNFDPSIFGDGFGSNLRAREGLLFEENSNNINIIYATNKAILNRICDLYGQGLYHQHLASLHSALSDNALINQKYFVDYANKNNIEIENEIYISLKPKKRFIKKKLDKEKSNVINFEQAT